MRYHHAIRLFCALVFAGGILTSVAHAGGSLENVKIKLKPKMITDSELGETTPALGVSCSWEAERSVGQICCTYASIKSEVKLDGAIAEDPDLNKEPLTGLFRFGGYLDFKKHSDAPPTLPDVVTGEIPHKLTTPDQNRGSLGFAVGGGYEINQQATEGNVYISAELMYVKGNEKDCILLIPTVIVGYDQAWSRGSETRDELGADDSSFQRARISAAWKWKIGELADGRPGLAWLVPVTLYADLRHVKEFNPEEAWENAGLDESTYFAGTVTYEINNEKITKYINSVFFQVSTGRIPPETDNSTNFMVGVEVPAEGLLGMVFGSR